MNSLKILRYATSISRVMQPRLLVRLSLLALCFVLVQIQVRAQSPQTSYYAYKAGGAWHNPKTWTFDPTGQSLTPSEGAGVPVSGSAVEIKNTENPVFLDQDVAEQSLDITISGTATLDLRAKTFTESLFALRGDGRLLIKSAYVPQIVGFSPFFAANGGTLRWEVDEQQPIYIQGFPSTFWNVEFAGKATYAYQLKVGTKLQILKDLRVEQEAKLLFGGIPNQPEEGTSFSRKWLTVYGDLTVAMGAALTVVEGNVQQEPLGSDELENYQKTSHSLELYGNFRNKGTVRLHNEANLDFARALTNANHVTVFVRGSDNREFRCESFTDLYNLVVDKEKESSALKIAATDRKYFRLWGQNVAASSKALCINKGILQLAEKTALASLCERGKYTLLTAATLRLDGEEVLVVQKAQNRQQVADVWGLDVSKVAGVSQPTTENDGVILEIQGHLHIKKGTYSVGDGGIIKTGSSVPGYLHVESGKLFAPQIHSGFMRFTYQQDGGLVVVRGKRSDEQVDSYDKTVASDHVYGTTYSATPNFNLTQGAFSLTNEQDIYIHTAGELRIVGAGEKTPTEGSLLIDIRASDEGTHVRGGKEVIDLTGLSAPQLFTIQSKVSFGDMLFKADSDGQELRLLRALRARGSVEHKKGLFNIMNYELTVDKNLVLEAPLNAKNGNLKFDLVADAIFEIRAGGSLVDNTIKYLELTKVLEEPSTPTPPERELRVSFPNDITCKELRLYRPTNCNIQNPASRIIVTTRLDIVSKIYGGQLVLDGTVWLPIGWGRVEDCLLTPNTKVNMASTLRVEKVITLSQGSTLDIHADQLQLFGGAKIVTTGDNSGYITTTGKSSDGGVSKVFSSADGNSFFIPFAHIIDGQRIDRSMTISWTTPHNKTARFWYVNGKYPKLLESYPFYIRIDTREDLSGLKLTMKNHEPTLPATYRLLYFRENTGEEIGIPTPIELVFDLRKKGDYAIGENRVIASYVSVQDGNWNDPATWSPNAVPNVGDIVHVKHRVFVAPLMPIYPDNSFACGDLTIAPSATLDIPDMSLANIVRVSGRGKLRIALNPVQEEKNVFPNQPDFSAFFLSKEQNIKYYGTIEFYMTQSNAEVSLPQEFIVYGALICSYEAPDQTFVLNEKIKQRLTTESFFILSNPNGHSGARFSLGGIQKPYKRPCAFWVKGDCKVENVGFVFSTPDNTEHNVWFWKTPIFMGTANISFSHVSVPARRSGIMYLYQGLDDQTQEGLSFAKDKEYVSLIFVTMGKAKVTGNKPIRLRDVRFQLREDAELSIENTGGIVSVESVPNYWVRFLSGTVILKTAFDFHVTTNQPMIIHQKAALHVNNPATNVYIAKKGAPNSGLTFNGTLRIENGKVFVGSATLDPNKSADVVYTVNQSANLEVLGGELHVYGFIRRSGGTKAGSIRFVQTGGKIYVMPTKKPSGFAGFEIYGDTFRMTGGELIYAGSGGALPYGDFLIRSVDTEVTGGTLRLTGGGGNKRVYLSSTASFYNLSCEGSNQEVRLWGLPLGIKNDFSVSATSQFVADKEDLTIGGNFSCDGTFEALENTTTFSGVTQQISGSSTQMRFHNLLVKSANSLVYQVPLAAEILGNLVIEKSGTIRDLLDLGTAIWKLRGNIINHGGYKTQGNGALELVGATRPTLTGNGYYGSISVKTLSGAQANNDIHLRGELMLESGNFWLDRYLLHVYRGGRIDQMGSEHYVVTAGSFISKGIKQELAQGDKQVLFPLGIENHYTPATLSIADPGYVEDGGFVRVVNVANQFGVVGECRQKVLNYHWEVESQQKSLVGQFEFSCSKMFMGANMQLAKSAPMRFASAEWQQQTSKNLSADMQQLHIRWTYNNATSLVGRYTAGDPLCFLYIQEVESIATGGWSDPIWIPYQAPTGTLPLNLPDGPNGMTIHIRPEHTVAITQDDTKAKSVIFETPSATQQEGILKISPTAADIDLGAVSGRGALEIEKSELPTADYSHFWGCAFEGKLILAGNTDYEIPRVAADEYPYLTLTGSGRRVAPDATITVCKALQIAGTTVYDNTVHNKGLVLRGSIRRVPSASFRAGSGTAAIVHLQGSALQELGGADATFEGENHWYNLYVDNPAGVAIRDGGSLEVRGELRLKQGIVKTPRNTTGKLLLAPMSGNMSSVDPELQGHVYSYIDGPLYLNVTASITDFRFPLGVGSTLANQLVLRDLTPGTLAVEVVPNTVTTLQSPLAYVDQARSWRVSGTVPSAKVSFVTDGFDWTATHPDDGLAVVKLTTTPSDVWEEIASTVVTRLFGREVNATSTESFLPTPSVQYYSLGTRRAIAPVVTFANLTTRYCAATDEMAQVPLRFSYSGNWADYLPMEISYKVGAHTRTLTIPTSTAATDIINFPVAYADAALANDTYIVLQIVSLTYNNQGTPTSGLHDANDLKVYRTPLLDPGTYIMCFTNGSSVFLSATAVPMGVVTWTNQQVQGVFDNPNALATKFTLTETKDGLQLFLKVDNNGCVAEKEAIMHKNPNPPTGSIAGLTPVCALTGTPILENYTFTPDVPGSYAYRWSLKVPLPVNNLHITPSTVEQNPVQVHWSPEPPYPGATAYKATLELEVNATNGCRAVLEKPIEVWLENRTAPLYYIPYLGDH